MELPKLQKTQQYVGLYVVDFGNHCGTGFTAQEVAELAESEKYKHIKVYKIHRAYPDGRLELKGVRNETLQLEAGMFFYSVEAQTAQSDFKQLINLAVRAAPPCRAKVHLAKYTVNKFAVAIIYPAEYDDEVSRWLLDGKYQTNGAAEGGIEAVQRYYDANLTILEKQQLFGKSSFENRTGEELVLAVKKAIQR